MVAKVATIDATTAVVAADEDARVPLMYVALFPFRAILTYLFVCEISALDLFNWTYTVLDNVRDLGGCKFAFC